MIKINIPSALRSYAGGDREAEFDVANIGMLIDAVVGAYPELQTHLIDAQGELLSFVNIFVNEDNIRDLAGRDTPLTDHDEVFIVPAMAGG